MDNLQLGLLGRPFLQLNNTPLPKPLSHKALGLVYYLAVTGQAHSREELAGLLWSDLDEDRARRNLRVELAKIRPILNHHLIIQRRSVAFDRESQFELDVSTFSANLNRPDPSLEQLETAVLLYRGDFLEDFSLRGAILFDEWTLVQRERLRQMAMDGLYKLARGYQTAGELEKGITAVRRLLSLEPWLEEGHRQLMVLLAKSGQRAAALAQYDTCTTVLSAELGVMPAPETDKLYDRIEAGEFDPGAEETGGRGAEGLSPQHLNTPALPIPFQPLPRSEHFVGRDAEIERLQEQLTAPNGPHVVALVGMGGVGKSTLANQLAHTLRDAFADGVLWADAKASEPLDILDSWGQAYGYDFSGLSDVKNRAAAVRGMLADKKVLLVLDDVVQVARIRPLIPNGAYCAILLTTRDLDVASALDAEEMRLGELSPENGVALLTSILGEKRVKAEPEAAAEICTLLHNLPLAVEITAQRLKSRRRRRLADMARRLADMDQRLGLEISDRAVRASFEVSWGALDSSLKQIFGLLGVFQGRPFAAPALAHIAELDAYETEDHLFGLTALSLLAEEGDIHFRQHPLLADFAQEKLAANGEAYVVHKRMSTYYHAFASTYQTDYAALQPEWPNLMAGMRTAHDQENWPLVLNYADTLSGPWFARTRFSEMQQGMEWAEKAAVSTNNNLSLANTILKRGEIFLEQNAYEEAKTFLQNSLSIFSNLEDKRGASISKYHLGRVTLESTQDYEAALDYLVESFELSNDINDVRQMASSLYRQARVWANFGPDFVKSNHLAQQALAMQRKESDKLGQIITLRLLTENALSTKNLAEAQQLCNEAFALTKDVEDLGELAATLYLFVMIYRIKGDFETSIQYGEKSLAIFQKMGSLRWQAMVQLETSISLEGLHQYSEALAIGLKSLKILEQLQDRFGQAHLLIHLSDLYKKLANPESCQDSISQATQIAIELKNNFLLQLITARSCE